MESDGLYLLLLHKRGVLWGYIDPDEVRVEADDTPRDYAPSSMNHHFFYGRCGCSTYSRTPDWTSLDENGETTKERTAINLWLLDEPDVQALPVEVIDGRSQW